MTIGEAQSVLDATLRGQAWFAGTGQGHDVQGECLIVYATECAGTPPEVPAVVDGFRVVVRHIGQIRPQ